MELPKTSTPVSWERAVDFAQRAFEAVGVPREDALRAGAALVDADLHSTFTHGLKNLKMYVTQVTSGKVNPRPNIREVGGGKAARVLTADNALGHVAGHYGMAKAIELAREYGVGSCFVRDSNHYGASGYWARLALRENMVGFAFTTALASMAPWGAKRMMVGNNPPAWVIPTQLVGPGEGVQPGASEPVFLDIALSIVAGNRLDIFKRRGDPIPHGWALDREGNDTNDPAIRADGGSFLPIAAYKGSGLAIVLALINTMLTDAPFDDERFEGELGGPQKFGTCCHWFEAYDIKQFVDPVQFTARVKEVQERIRSAEPRAGFERVFAPGDIENERAARWRTDGIPLEDFVIDELGWVAEHVGIELNLV